MTSARRAIGWWAAALGLAVAGALALLVVPRDESSGVDTGAGPRIAQATRTLPPPFLMFRTLGSRDLHGRVAMSPLDRPAGVRYVTPLLCTRVAYAAGAGICLTEEIGDVRVAHVAHTFDDRFRRRHRLELAGIPVRARMSPDGRRAAVTVYAEEESPSGERLVARSVLIDVASGAVSRDVAEYSLSTDGFPSVHGPGDVGGVAFVGDSDRFVATLVTDDGRYLVSGAIRAQRLTVIARGLANEAVSPDGRRLIAKTAAGRGLWQLVVVDLAGVVERVLDHATRSIDDQVEWLDESHIVYHDAADTSTGVWVMPVDEPAPPRLLVADAYSPTVAR